MQRCLVNGQVQGDISCSDRGLLYGDGLFETMAVVNGKLPLWAWHHDRFTRSCARLKLSCPPRAVLEAEIAQLASDVDRAVIKLMLTRGVGGRGYATQADAIPTRILQRHAWPALPDSFWQTGIKAIFCEQRLARQPALAGIKHLNRLEQVLARAEWDDPAIQEGVMTDTDGHIIEAVSHNIFIVAGGTVITPDLQFSGVAGVMRQYILSYLEESGQTVKVTALRKQDLITADGVFVCNSLHGIWPVCELDGKHYPLNGLICELRDHIAHILPYP